MPAILIELPGGEGVVRRDDGEIVLTHDITLDWGQPLQPWDRYQPIRLGLSSGRMLFGGLLPPGAASVEAVEATGIRKAAAVGDGTYAVIFEDGDHSEPVLGFRDAKGAFVHRPMPAAYPHRPVVDAEEPCPMCGAVDYEEYFPTEDWRGGYGQKGTPSFVPSPLIVCRVCGHQEPAGVITRLGQQGPCEEDPAERAARLARATAEQAVHRWYSDKMTLLNVTFPIYAAEGWTAWINGQASSGNDLVSLTIANAETRSDSMLLQRPRIEITTSIEPHQPGELALARDTFASGMDARVNQQPSDGLSDAALTLWFRARRRGDLAASRAAPVSETQITIDGAPAPFVAVGTLNDRWVAVRRHHDVTITIRAREVAPSSLTLEPIVDLNARLLGPPPAES